MKLLASDKYEQYLGWLLLPNTGGKYIRILKGARKFFRGGGTTWEVQTQRPAQGVLEFTYCRARRYPCEDLKDLNHLMSHRPWIGCGLGKFPSFGNLIVLEGGIISTVEKLEAGEMELRQPLNCASELRSRK
jgi:hypothetical protein